MNASINQKPKWRSRGLLLGLVAAAMLLVPAAAQAANIPGSYTGDNGLGTGYGYGPNAVPIDGPVVGGTLYVNNYWDNGGSPDSGIPWTSNPSGDIRRLTTTIQLAPTVNGPWTNAADACIDTAASGAAIDASFNDDQDGCESYVFANSDYGKYVRVVATAASNTSGTSPTNSGTVTVRLVDEFNLPVVVGGTPAYFGANPVISGAGNGLVGTALAITATNVVAGPAATVAYQWQRSTNSGSTWNPISGATQQTYTVQAGDVGADLRAKVTASNALNEGVPAVGFSNVKAAVAARPVNSAAPTAAGTARLGSWDLVSAGLGQFANNELTSTPGTWSSTLDKETPYAYQWQYCDNTSVALCNAIGEGPEGWITVSAVGTGGGVAAFNGAFGTDLEPGKFCTDDAPAQFSFDDRYGQRATMNPTQGFATPLAPGISIAWPDLGEKVLRVGVLAIAAGADFAPGDCVDPDEGDYVAADAAFSSATAAVGDSVPQPSADIESKEFGIPEFDNTASTRDDTEAQVGDELELTSEGDWQTYFADGTVSAVNEDISVITAWQSCVGTLGVAGSEEPCADDGTGWKIVGDVGSEQYTITADDASGFVRLGAQATNAAGSNTAASAYYVDADALGCDAGDYTFVTADSELFEGTNTGIAGEWPEDCGPADEFTGIPGVAPKNTVRPTISGAVAVGNQLSANPGTWDGAPAPTITIVWQISASASGPWTDVGTTNVYTPAAPDNGKFIRIVAEGTNGQGSPATASSTPVQIAAAQAPSASISSKPAKKTKSKKATFSFGASQANVNFECKLDGGSWVYCNSPKTYSGLARKSHTFQVRATNQYGVTGGAASYSWTVKKKKKK